MLEIAPTLLCVPLFQIVGGWYCFSLGFNNPKLREAHFCCFDVLILSWRFDGSIFETKQLGRICSKFSPLGIPSATFPPGFLLEKSITDQQTPALFSFTQFSWLWYKSWTGNPKGCHHETKTHSVIQSQESKNLVGSLILSSYEVPNLGDTNQDKVKDKDKIRIR